MRIRVPVLMVLLPAACFLTALPGCSSGSRRSNMGMVKGLVTYQGNPLPGGTIHFVLPDSEYDTAFWIQGDGTYQGEVPIGVARVWIETKSVKSKDKEAMLEEWQEKVGQFMVHKKKQPRPDSPAGQGPRMVYTPIPAHYGDPDKSGFVVEISSGQQEFDFPLVGSAPGTSP